MRKNGELIMELAGFMDAMSVGWYDSNKIYAEARLLSHDECEVVEMFDTGEGHSGAYYSTYSPVDMLVFEEALRRNFITGKLKSGYVSKTEFALTRNVQLLNEIHPMVAKWQEKDYWKKRSEYDVQHGKGPGTYVKVMKVDECQLPDHVRAVSAGVVLSADPLVRFSVIAGQRHAEARDSDRLPGTYIYVVPRAEAIKLFSDLNREVGVYWEMLSFPRTNKDKTLLFFRGTEVEEIAGTFIRPTIDHE